MQRVTVLWCGIFALIALMMTGFSAIASQEGSEEELFVKIREAETDGQVEALLLEVPETLKDIVKFDGLTVNQILSYRDSSCNLERLLDSRVLNWKRYYLYSSHINSGLYRFVRARVGERRLKCGAKLPSILKEVVDELLPEDVEIIKRLHSTKRISYRSDILAKKLEVKERFQSCVRIIHKLSAIMSFDYISQKLDFGSPLDSFVKNWYDMLETCKIYTEKQCHKQSKRTADTSIEEQCKEISEIGISNKTKEKWYNI